MKLINRRFIKEYEADATNVGTPAYKGEAYFWHPEYKHSLRGIEAPPGKSISWASVKAMRVRVHNELLREGLKLVGVSKQHKEIVLKHWTKCYNTARSR